MAPQRAIDLALDLARMPAVAPSMAAAPLPTDVLDVIRIAAEVARALSRGWLGDRTAGARC